MTPEQLSKEIRDCIIATREEPCGYTANQVLRIVLKAIEDGEVVQQQKCMDCSEGIGIVLKPDFKKFMEEK